MVTANSGVRTIYFLIWCPKQVPFIFSHQTPKHLLACAQSKTELFTFSSVKESSRKRGKFCKLPWEASKAAARSRPADWVRAVDFHQPPLYQVPTKAAPICLQHTAWDADSKRKKAKNLTALSHCHQPGARAVPR